MAKKWPVFLYEFSWNELEPGLAGHFAEVPEVFGQMILPWSFNAELSGWMIDYWTSFALSGIPKSSGAGVVCPRYQMGNGYVEFEEEVIEMNGFHERQCQFWINYAVEEENYVKMVEFCLQQKELQCF